MKLTANKSAVALAVALLCGGFLASGLVGPKGLEGNPGKPYMDVGGVWTDCYGNTKNVAPTKVRTDAECKALLSGEAERIANLLATKAGHEIPAPTLAAFISFAYNVGDTATLNSRAFAFLKAGDFDRACRQLLRWTYVKGKFIQGLANRRDVEFAVCMQYKVQP